MSLFLISACANAPEAPVSNYGVIGSFVASYDAEFKSLEIHPANKEFSNIDVSSMFGLDYNNSTGALNCAIKDHSKSPGEINYCMGLVDPDSCSTDYNDVTKVLSFYIRMVNKSNLPNNYNETTNPTGYEYTDTDTYPPNTTFYGPFHFRITGLWGYRENDGTPISNLINTVNTSLPGADCGSNGLDLVEDDLDGNGFFDCIYPDETPTMDDDGDPGWDLTPNISAANMTPSEDTGCVQFMQFVLNENGYFDLGFDLLGIIDDGSPLPATPTISTPSNGDYINTDNVTVSGSCTSGGTVLVEGGDDSGTYPVTTSCSGSSYSVSVPLNPNQENNLSVYQQVNLPPLKQSPSAQVSVVHDNIAPSILGTDPNNAQTGVDRNTNCVFAFSEPMLDTTFDSGTNCSNGTFRMCRGGTFLSGDIEFSGDYTQASYAPDNKPLNANSSHNCKATTGLTDLAGNPLSTEETVTFTTVSTAADFQDTTPPFVVGSYPFDNASDISPNTLFTIEFNEAIDADTIVGNVIDSNCTDGSIPNVMVFELNSCDYQTAQTVPGTTTLSADGKHAIFTPTNPLQDDYCFGFVISACIADLAGNTLPSRGERSIGAYNADILYNTYDVFFTGTSDTTAPTLVHVGPITSATDVKQTIEPFFVFDETIDPSTAISDYFFLTKFGYPDPLGAKVRYDTTSQVITIDPSSVLNDTTTARHVQTATGAVSDYDGNQMVAPQTSDFEVSSTADTTPPMVLSVTPDQEWVSSPGSCGTSGNYISKCSTFDVVFSEPLDTTSITSGNIAVYNLAGPTSCTPEVKPAALEISDDAMSVRVVPVNAFRSGGACGGDRRRYYIEIDGVRDRAGNVLSSTYQSTIYTACQESEAPTVTHVVPSGGNVPRNQTFAVFFSEEMDRSTLTASNVSMNNCTPIINAIKDGTIAMVNCINEMNSGYGWSLSVNTNVRDYYHPTNNQSCEADSGNRMSSNHSTSFTVSNYNDTTSPTITSVSPSDGSTGVSSSIAPVITFNEAIDPRTMIPSTIFLMGEKGDRRSARLSLSTDATQVTITPDQTLPSGTYYIIATTAVRDLSGGNPYDGDGGENTSFPGVLRTTFSVP